jgi:hypothetical protein
LEGGEGVVLSGAPIALDAAPADGPLPRLIDHGGAPAILWRAPMAPAGFPCRIERIGVGDEEWTSATSKTAGWSPFNFAVRARSVRGDDTFGWNDGQRYTFLGGAELATAAGGRESAPPGAARDRGSMVISRARLPDDAPTPPRSP